MGCQDFRLGADRSRSTWDAADAIPYRAFGGRFRIAFMPNAGLVGIAWLFGVKFFLLFFDRYLSRN